MAWLLLSQDVITICSVQGQALYFEMPSLNVTFISQYSWHFDVVHVTGRSRPSAHYSWSFWPRGGESM